MRTTPGKGKRSRALERKAKRAARLAVPELKVEVTFRHVEPTDALRQYAERKFGHVAKALRRPSEAHLILSVDKYRHSGEVTFKSGRLAATAVEEDRDLYAVIDLLADKIGGQLKRHVEKMTAKKTRVPSAPEILGGGAAEEPESV